MHEGRVLTAPFSSPPKSKPHTTTGQTLAKVADISGADFSDMLLDRFLQTTLCKKASGTNPKTGADTRESLMCE